MSWSSCLLGSEGKSEARTVTGVTSVATGMHSGSADAIGTAVHPLYVGADISMVSASFCWELGAFISSTFSVLMNCQAQHPKQMKVRIAITAATISPCSVLKVQSALLLSSSAPNEKSLQPPKNPSLRPLQTHADSNPKKSLPLQKVHPFPTHSLQDWLKLNTGSKAKTRNFCCMEVILYELVNS